MESVLFAFLKKLQERKGDRQLLVTAAARVVAQEQQDIRDVLGAD